ncbi:MAG: [citrate (pro-3S)-lyase] ligase [Acidaminobacteraceae bacterium]
MYLNYRIKDLYINKIENDFTDVKNLLDKYGLDVEENIEYTIGIYDKETLIATGSIKENVVLCIAVDGSYENSNLINILMSEINRKLLELKIRKTFIFTKENLSTSFEHLGYSLVTKVNRVALLEHPPNGIENFIDEIKANLSLTIREGSVIGSVIMNCNPFTLGHRYLIEEALKKCDFLYIFVVEEDKSSFKFKDRLEIVKLGVEDLQNVQVFRGGDYIISRASFPSYFLKDANVSENHADIDIDIFCRYIVPAFNIKKRFVGTEPFCENTKRYNNQLKSILFKHSIELIEIERLKIDDKYVSASEVRQNIVDSKNTNYEKLLHPNTVDFISNIDKNKLVENINSGNGRH